MLPEEWIPDSSTPICWFSMACHWCSFCHIKLDHIILKMCPQCLLSVLSPLSSSVVNSSINKWALAWYFIYHCTLLIFSLFPYPFVFYALFSQLWDSVWHRLLPEANHPTASQCTVPPAGEAASHRFSFGSWCLIVWPALKKFKAGWILFSPP